MTSLFSKLRLESAARVLPLLPESLQARVGSPDKTWTHADLREIAAPERGKTRLIIAPANYAGQGFRWARAAETIPGVAAANLQRRSAEAGVGDGFAFPADASVRKNVWAYSHLWQRRQQEALENATHVIIEAASPIVPTTKDDRGAWRLTVQEVRDLQAKGVKVALLWHGTDVRLPSKHAELEKFSPYTGFQDFTESRLERVVRENYDLADELGVTEFVSNPYLRAFRPTAVWLPTQADPERWDMVGPGDRCPQHARPVVLHAPSSGPMKGTDAIRGAMAALDERGLIDYREITGVPSEDMPRHVAEADIVIDGIRNGQYGVASLEAMLARRVAVAHVWDSVRKEMATTTGMDLPVVEANPETIGRVVESLVSDPDLRRELGERGREYVLNAHSQAAAARVLSGFLLH